MACQCPVNKVKTFRFGNEIQRWRVMKTSKGISGWGFFGGERSAVEMMMGLGLIP